MRWMWIDKIIDFEAGNRLSAVKNVSLSEEHLHDHFAADERFEAQPIMPASLIIEGMAQTAGILVGAVSRGLAVLDLDSGLHHLLLRRDKRKRPALCKHD